MGVSIGTDTFGGACLLSKRVIEEFTISLLRRSSTCEATVVTKVVAHPPLLPLAIPGNPQEGSYFASCLGRPKQVLPPWGKMDLGVMMTKGLLQAPQASVLQYRSLITGCSLDSYPGASDTKMHMYVFIASSP